MERNLLVSLIVLFAVMSACGDSAGLTFGDSLIQGDWRVDEQYIIQGENDPVQMTKTLSTLTVAGDSQKLNVGEGKNFSPDTLISSLPSANISAGEIDELNFLVSEALCQNGCFYDENARSAYDLSLDLLDRLVLDIASAHFTIRLVMSQDSFRRDGQLRF